MRGDFFVRSFAILMVLSGGLMGTLGAAPLNAYREGDRFARSFIKASLAFASKFSGELYAEQVKRWVESCEESEKKYEIFKEYRSFLKAGIVHFKSKRVKKAAFRDGAKKEQRAIFYLLCDMMYANLLADYMRLNGTNPDGIQNTVEVPFKKVKLTSFNPSSEMLKRAVRRAYGFDFRLAIQRLEEVMTFLRNYYLGTSRQQKQP